MDALHIKKDILATLTYFNMFNYPLKKREIYTFLGHKETIPTFEKALNTLIDEAAVYKLGDFYCLFNNYALAERRIKGNEKAITMLKKAEQSAAIIAAFPFVKGIAVSGSLSKRFADDDADIDFFIITAPNRLWLCRSFLHVFKKITFLFRAQHLFCMNYFIDESVASILEKNIYTATEVATLLPLRGTAVFNQFYSANSWTKEFLPNQYMYVPAELEIKRTWFTLLTEKLLNNPVGNGLDNFLMKLTAKSWDKKKRTKKKNSKGILMGMHTGKHFSKPDPENFQKKILRRYENSLREILDHYEHSDCVKDSSL